MNTLAVTASKLKKCKAIFPSDSIYKELFIPIGVAKNEEGEIGILFDKEEHPFTKFEVISEDSYIITDIVIEPKVINKDTKDMLIEVVYFKDVFTGPFNNIEEFDEMFNNPDSILIL